MSDQPAGIAGEGPTTLQNELERPSPQWNAHRSGHALYGIGG